MQNESPTKAKKNLKKKFESCLLIVTSFPVKSSKMMMPNAGDEEAAAAAAAQQPEEPKEDCGVKGMVRTRTLTESEHDLTFFWQEVPGKPLYGTRP